MEMLKKVAFTCYWIAVSPITLLAFIVGGIVIGLVAFKQEWPKPLRKRWRKVGEVRCMTPDEIVRMFGSIGEDDNGS